MLPRNIKAVFAEWAWRPQGSVLKNEAILGFAISNYQGHLL
jgi:hypothetical protein